MNERPAVPRPAVVILGGESIAVAAARSLHAAGIEVHALGYVTDPVRHSRYCDVFVDLGAGDGVQQRWLDWLSESGPRGAVVLPCNDDALELLARNRARLTELGYRPIEAADDVLLAMLDKEETYRRAEAAGIPTPRMHLLRKGSDSDAVAGEIDFPCTLKPLQSHMFKRHFGRQKVIRVNDANELKRVMHELWDLDLEMMATEVIPGPDDSYCSYFGYLDEAGRPLFHITKRKPRQFPIHFGLGTYHITDSSPDVREQGERFLRELGLRGLANVEFKRDARDGRLKLIECNHRLTASTPVLQAAGADLPLLLYNRVTGAPIDGLANYRPGVWLWSPIQDVRALRAYRRQGELSLRQWARSLRGRPHFPVAKWTDPLPTVAFHARMVEQFVRRRWAARR